MSDDEPRNDGTRHDEDAARRAREDAAWRAIVDNYGDRPEVDLPPPPAEPEPPAHLFAFEAPPELGSRSWTPSEDVEADRYVPPPPPPVPRPHGLRAVAWLGLFGVPTVVLICIVLHVSLPSPLGFLAIVWFVGGFGYLVATMGGPRDPGGGSGDDGAVV